MGILTMNMKSIKSHRGDSITGGVEIKNNITITNIKESEKTSIKQKCISVEFTFSSRYFVSKEPFAEIKIDGDIIYAGDESAEIIKKWKDDKELLKKYYATIINTIFRRCAIKALQITEELQLPPLIGLPYVKEDKK